METSSSPLLSAGPDWRHYIRGNGSSNSLSIPLASSPSPAARTWGPQLLGGETVNKRDSLISSHNDPIGSRPSSRADAGSPSNQDGLRPIGSQRPSASVTAGVFAAASSATARSRANSPANFNVSSSDSAAPQIGMMGLGTSYMSQSFRQDNSSSPSFVSAQSSQKNNENRRSSSNLYQNDTTGTPTLVVQGFQSSKPSVGHTQQYLTATGDESNSGDIQSPLSPTGSASAALTSITKRPEGSNGNSNGMYGFSVQNTADIARHGAIQRIMTPQRSDTGASLNSSTRGHPAISSPAPFLTLPSGGNASYAPQQHSSLLSPTPATLGGSSDTGLSLSTSPPRGMVGNEMLAAPLPRHAESLSNDVLDADAHSQGSPFLVDLLDRLARVELSVKDINRNISGLSRNVSLLLDRTKHLPASSNVNTPSQRYPATLHQQVQNAAASTQGTPEDVRMISSQLAQLSSQVPQLAMQGHSPNPPLAGLGLATATPPISSSAFAQTSGLQGGSRMGYSNDSPRLGLGGYPNIDRNSRLSPRPGGNSPSPSNRRWNSMTPGLGDNNSAQSVPPGAMHPPDPSVIVTKWEHLNLHPDLLRCILKYGLGPPNKIQQRALPFLLRGSDIIAQAPPTQERIASYVIPVLQLVLNVLRGEPMPSQLGVRGPIAIIISTTVDQATQAQRMALGLGSALGVRVHIAAASSVEVSQEAAGLIQMQPQIVVGTPQKMMDLFNYLANKTKGAISLDDIRMVVLDEVDQLIARNLADYVSTLLRILPQPRTIAASPQPSPGIASPPGDAFSPFDSAAPGPTAASPFNVSTAERQTAIFSNTVPQDVLNFAQSIHLRESVRVLVRRDTAGGQSQGLTSHSSALNVGASAGGQQQHSMNFGSSIGNIPTNQTSDSILTALRGLRQYYLYVPVSTSGASIGGYQSPNPSQSHMQHAIEMKLDVITDLLEDMEFSQAVIYTSTASTHEVVTYKLASKGIEALALHRDMASTTRQQVIAKYRSGSNLDARYQQAGNAVVGSYQRSTTPTISARGSVIKKTLVVFDTEINSKDVGQVPLIVFYDLPRSVEEYKDKIACAVAPAGQSNRSSVCINVVTGSGGPRGDIEMLRTIECHIGCKMAELPMNSTQLLNY
jgi:superfamily II DNA/RNA helicase